ncbi:MAG TPA: 2-succinyl-6-hydroxy-2,4-cyclohexadiene-1-carboxylate synthase [Chloroflexota bacterium]|nr:2-succinyl-6-hydroxy-2,4-cyclohexadiene-1-carboxylate synthase [Chloroflexota bacterium]
MANQVVVTEAAARERVIPVNGIRYRVTTAGSGPPLLLLHGFAGSGETWEEHRATLGAHFRTLAVDLLGHGGTDAPPDPARYTMAQTVADLQALCDILLSPLPDGGGERYGLLGYSMGGRVALNLALAEPDRVGALILESTSPGIADPEERAKRRRGDEELAEFTERKGVAAFTRRWEALPLFASQRRLALPIRHRQRAERLRNTPRGLANSLRGLGAGVPEPVHDRLGELTMPTLLIAGELDERYRAHAEAMLAALPHARLALIPDAGHNVHLEQPKLFDTQILEFFREMRDQRAAPTLLEHKG